MSVFTQIENQNHNGALDNFGQLSKYNLGDIKNISIAIKIKLFKTEKKNNIGASSINI